MSLARKVLISSTVGAAIFILLTSVLVASVSYNIAGGFLEDQSENQLVSIRDVQKSQLLQYLKTIEKQVITFSNNEMISTAAQHFTRTFKAFERSIKKAELDPGAMRSDLEGLYSDGFGRAYRAQNTDASMDPVEDILAKLSDQAVYAQYFFIHQNKYPRGQRSELNEISLRSAYGQTHKRFHPFIRKYLQEFGYQDIYIIEPKAGHVVYSTEKEIEFGSSLLNGPFSSTGLADVFKRAAAETEPDFVAFSPFKPYSPSMEIPASFVASPIVDVTGRITAILAFKIPIDKVNRVLTYENKWREHGLGDTGETYLVGEDYLVQSQDRLLQEDFDSFIDIVRQSGLDDKTLSDIELKRTSIGLQEIRTEAAMNALEGETGFAGLTNYRGAEVLSAYTPIEFGGYRFALIAEMEEAEAFAYRKTMISSVALSVVAIVLVILLIVGALVWRGTRIFSNLLQRAVEIANTVAQGKKATITEAAREDEIGALMKALDRMQSELIAGYEDREVKTARITNALNVASTNMMVVNRDYEIVYANESLYRMFETGKAEWQRQFPGMPFDKLTGQNLLQLSSVSGLSQSELGPTHVNQVHDVEIGLLSIQVITNSVSDEAGNRIGTVIELLDRTAELETLREERATANENARIREALDNVHSNVVVADADREIIYLNKSAFETLSLAEADIKTDIPEFQANQIKGQSLEFLHTDREQQRAYIDSMTGTSEYELNLGSRTFDFSMSPVLNDQKERLGTVVELSDRTLETSIEQEVDDLVASAAAGDLSKRISLEGKQGFIERLSIGLNKLIDINDAFVRDIGELFGNMAKGDLGHTIDTDYFGQFEQIKLNANESIAKLNNVMSKITATSSSVWQAANHVSSGGQKLSESTEKQATSLEYTSQNMEKINNVVRENAGSTDKANTLADDAKRKAGLGRNVVQEAVHAMEAILESSNKINDIIGVIDEISFQTNLLALNAAVEAARAGEHGRGFAVVASEVRNLSQRSSVAAKEIKNLISDSVAKVATGSDLVHQSGSTLEEILTAVNEVAGIIDQVNESASEQTNGIGQIKHEINQMDEQTQQNAGLVTEVMNSSRDMINHSNMMKELVTFFRT